MEQVEINPFAEIVPLHEVEVNRITIPDSPLLQGLGGDFALAISAQEIARRTKRAYFSNNQVFNTVLDLKGIMKHAADICIVGAGPSVLNDIELIRKYADPESGVIVMALNNAHDLLLEHDITPDLAVLIEMKDRAADYITPRDGVGYIIATTVADCTLDRFRPFARNTHLFHTIQDHRHQKQIQELNRTFSKINIPGLSGGTSVMLRMFDFAPAWLEARRLLMFGCDSSGSSDAMHAKDKGFRTPAQIGLQLQHPSGKSFKRVYPTTRSMARQAGEFWEYVNARAANIRSGTMQPFQFIMHGRGLLPDWAACEGFHANSKEIIEELEKEGFDENAKTYFTPAPEALTFAAPPIPVVYHFEGAVEGGSFEKGPDTSATGCGNE